MATYYETLGLQPSARPDEIKRAYKSLALKYHPDRNTLDPQAEERFKLINEAYQTLSDPEKKRAYDDVFFTPETEQEPSYAERRRSARQAFNTPESHERAERYRASIKEESDRRSKFGKYGSLAIIVLLVLFLGYAKFKEAETIQKEFDKGKKALAEGRNSEAYYHFWMVKNKKPKHQDALSNMAEILANLDKGMSSIKKSAYWINDPYFRLIQASSFIDTLILENPQTPLRFYLLRAKCNYALGQKNPELIKTAYKDFLYCATADKDALLPDLMFKEMEEMGQSYTSKIPFRPDTVTQQWKNYGELLVKAIGLQKAKRWDEAWALFEKAEELSIEEGGLYYWMALNKKGINEIDSACYYWNKALGMDIVQSQHQISINCFR